jgi:hypothetical protein
VLKEMPSWALQYLMQRCCQDQCSEFGLACKPSLSSSLIHCISTPRAVEVVGLWGLQAIVVEVDASQDR